MSSLVSQGYGSDSEEEEMQQQLEKKKISASTSNVQSTVKKGRVQIVLEPRKALEKDEPDTRRKTVGSGGSSLSSLLPAPRKIMGSSGSKQNSTETGSSSRLVPRSVGKAPAPSQYTHDSPVGQKRKASEGVNEDEFFSIDAKDTRGSLFHQPKAFKAVKEASTLQEDDAKFSNEIELKPSGTDTAPTVEAEEEESEEESRDQPAFEELLDDEAVSRDVSIGPTPYLLFTCQ
ncbi:hypothetical protein BJ684DRAFT_21009 [Piptocephalis cylindrospora]|uniref:Uncharacterized protein n=1 Tax=Piptocephalis cylindrospora TaxID=1907219 RepID=A0A4P9Y1P4_9FUNG|nr:hypothetical protein BJ684DRAFT_21009 [Piptocephalis cylindrospora]|eukprot:RKP12452.1 hypothetical protein BJ684DRAFT_21009 [Piptocephalis cylindrospora]